MIDSSWRTFYTRFRSSQSLEAISLEITSIAYLNTWTWKCQPSYQKSYRKRNWPIHQIPFKAHFMRIFDAAKASLVGFNKEFIKVANWNMSHIKVSLQIWHVSIHTDVVPENIPFSTKALLILGLFAKNPRFLVKVVPLLKALVRELC